MDAGLAAVLGALAGAVGTAFAGLAAGRASREQARIAARSEHRRQNQPSRKEAYLQLLETAGALRDHVIPQFFGYEELDRPPITEAFFHETKIRRLALRTAWLSVTLAGPRPVVEAADYIDDSAENLMKYAGVIFGLTLASRDQSPEEERHWDPIRAIDEQQLYAHQELSKLGQYMKIFTDLAQQALDDDGSL